MDNGQGKRNRHSRIDGVATFPQNRKPRLRRKLIRAGNYRVRSPLWLLDHRPGGFEFETGLGNLLRKSRAR
jgi:hypothetical protein